MRRTTSLHSTKPAFYLTMAFFFLFMFVVLQAGTTSGLFNFSWNSVYIPLWCFDVMLMLFLWNLNKLRSYESISMDASNSEKETLLNVVRTYLWMLFLMMFVIQMISFIDLSSSWRCNEPDFFDETYVRDQGLCFGEILGRDQFINGSTCFYNTPETWNILYNSSSQAQGCIDAKYLEYQINQQNLYAILTCSCDQEGLTEATKTIETCKETTHPILIVVLTIIASFSGFWMMQRSYDKMSAPAAISIDSEMDDWFDTSKMNEAPDDDDRNDNEIQKEESTQEEQTNQEEFQTDIENNNMNDDLANEEYSITDNENIEAVEV